MVKKLVFILALVIAISWAVPEPAVEGQIGYQVTATTVAQTAYPLLAPNGTAGAPSFAYTNDADSGGYLAGVGNLAFAVGGVLVLDIEDTNAAGAGADLVTISSTTGIMDGSDTVRGLFIDLTSADHTGSSNLLYGLDIDAITGDAQATEYPIYLGNGWDSEIVGQDNIRIGIDNAAGAISGSWTGGITMFTSRPSGTTPNFDISGNISAAGTTNSLFQVDPGAITVQDGSDTFSFINLTGIPAADHTGSGNNYNALGLGAIGVDAQSTMNIFWLGDGYDYFLNDQVDTALGTLTWTTNADKTGNTASGTLKVFINNALYHIQLFADS